MTQITKFDFLDFIEKCSQLMTIYSFHTADNFFDNLLDLQQAKEKRCLDLTDVIFIEDYAAFENETHVQIVQRYSDLYIAVIFAKEYFDSDEKIFKDYSAVIGK